MREQSWVVSCVMWLCVWLFITTGANAEEVQVAVAANFVSTMKDIAAEFERGSKHKVQVTPGSSGKFYAQIKNGAPFDVLLSADDERPKLLEDEGLGVKGSRFTYAVGRLVLWSQDPALVTGQDTLKTATFKHLAIANPKLAPYGVAAMQAMIKLGLWESLQSRIVMGENLGQTAGFLESGNAELGFLALAQVLDEKLKGKGSRWEVPESLHEPIRQDAVLLTKGESNPAAKSFLEFLHSQEARVIMERYGYRVE
jgi:molybdate transport system substrate-binding protein